MNKSLPEALRYGLVSILFLSSCLLAEEPDTKLEDISLLQIVMPLFLVIILIFALAWLVKKMNIGTPTLGKGITVLASSPLSGHARVSLITVDDKTFLLGVTSQQVSLIHTFDEPPVPIANRENASDFAGHFKHLLQGNKRESDGQKPD